jgi:hypothetical protein
MVDETNCTLEFVQGRGRGQGPSNLKGVAADTDNLAAILINQGQTRSSTFEIEVK